MTDVKQQSSLLMQAEAVIKQLSLSELLWLLERLTQRIRELAFSKTKSCDNGTESSLQSLQYLREEIANHGGLYPQQTDDMVLAKLAQTREELYAQKYAAHFGHE
jgi:predicted nucleic acid-binding protein